MKKRSTRLKDSVTVISYIKVKQPNGDIVESLSDSNIYRCNATDSGTELEDRVYDVPQFKFDYVLRMRPKTVQLGGFTKATRVQISPEGTLEFQVTRIIKKNDKEWLVYVNATDI